MNKWEGLQQCTAAMDVSGVQRHLADINVIPPTIVCRIYHSLWTALRNGAEPKSVETILHILAAHGSNPLFLNETLEPFVADWNTPTVWLDCFNSLSQQHDWRTWKHGGFMHSVCINGAFHLKSIEYMLENTSVLLHKDIQGNTPWHIFWKDGQLEHLGYLRTHENYIRLNKIQKLFESHHLDPHLCNVYGESVHHLIQQRLEQMLRFHPALHNTVQKMWDTYIREPLAREIQDFGANNGEERKKI